MKPRFEIITSSHIGYCFGVKRAMNLVENHLKNKRERLYIIGQIIHNPQAVEKLNRMGAMTVESIDQVEDGATLVIRAHGVQPEIISEAKKRGIKLLDATCPFVHRSQLYVKEIGESSFDVIVIGDKEHPEVKGLEGHAKGRSFVVRNVEEARLIKGINKAGIVVQTTFAPEEAKKIIEELQNHIENISIYDTICQATVARREATLELGRSVDLMIIVGGKNSSNTRRLYKMCTDAGINSKFIERADEIDPSWTEGIKRVGISTGTSTPNWVIAEVIEHLRQIALKGDT